MQGLAPPFVRDYYACVHTRNNLAAAGFFATLSETEVSVLIGYVVSHFETVMIPEDLNVCIVDIASLSTVSEYGLSNLLYCVKLTAPQAPRATRALLNNHHFSEKLLADWEALAHAHFVDVACIFEEASRAVWCYPLARLLKPRKVAHGFADEKATLALAGELREVFAGTSEQTVLVARSLAPGWSGSVLELHSAATGILS